MQNLEIIKQSFIEVGSEIETMHDNFNNQIDLLKKMYER